MKKSFQELKEYHSGSVKDGESENYGAEVTLYRALQATEY